MTCVQGQPIFTRLNPVPKQYPYLTENISTEVVIIGGGVTGSITAYYFTQLGIDCVILEKSRIAHGSTSITTSLLQYELDSNLRELEQYTSLSNAIRSYELGIKALDEVKKFINQYGNCCDYSLRDTLLYTAKDTEVAELREEYELRKAHGFDVEFLDSHHNPYSFNLKAGVYSKQGGAELDPYKYTHHLLDVSTNQGLRVYENTEVTNIHYHKDYVEVLTEYEYTVKAKIAIVATGFDTKRFTSRAFGTKTTTYNIATKPVAHLDGWFNQVLIRDNEDPYNYFRTTPDNRLIAGGEDISFIPDIYNEKAAEEKYSILENRLKSMFPHIKDIEIDYKYCGAFASTNDNVGFLGKDPDHDKLWYCLGYGANGILFAILGGMMLSELYTGVFNNDLSLFGIDRFQ